ncbi:MAG: ATP-dependent DNA helicase [Candidatus Nanopelagicaceae bacterium]|nr:ATP-dependent DNA helicase [Candidatus Nanopelagicaceae bacterium]
MSQKILYSPEVIANKLRIVDPKVRIPSREQSAIIAAPLEPAVVIAGAGSGKTETMSARVLYLIANGLAKPEEILGLTFTRKAAGELGVRIRSKLRQLRDPRVGLEIPRGEPVIMTYHSYAGRLLNEHAIRYGIDASSDPIGEAAIWQMAARIVSNWPDDEFTSESALSTVIYDVIGLSRMVLEHMTSSDEIREISESLLAQLETLGTKSNDTVRGVQKVLQQRMSILPMVEELISTRQKNGELSFDDQMSLAARIAMEIPEVVEIERSKYRVVLLDEYQDTSQSQVRMLSSLFGDGHAVMAVGDPCQAIYTWRGASAGTIGAFAKNFPNKSGSKGKANAKHFSLPVTYRNDKIILQLANNVSEQIRENSPVEVLPLVARDGAGAGELAYGIFETLESEAKGISEYFSNLWFDPERMSKGEKERTSFAVLVRKRSQIAEIELALRGENIPVEVLGVGGLIHVAEVADAISLLRVITDPEAGASLMRHLTGPRINLGASDIAALGRFSRSRAEAQKTTSKGLVAKIVQGNPLREEADDQFLGSLIDAIDEIGSANAAHFTHEGFSRLTHFASDLRRIRSRAGGPLTDLVSEVESYLNLDVEVQLRDGTENGRRHLDRFMDEVAKFSRSGGTIADFLEWLDVASSEEAGLKSGAPEVRRDVVQILTIHTAKGAEWDVVAVPGLAKGNFPGNGLKRDNWLTNEEHIPFSLRGDSHELPTFDISGCSTNTEAKKVFDAFALECNKLRHDEEIRLGYVAITRARTHLICTTSRWRDGINPVEPSEIYELVAQTALVHGGMILADAPAPQDEDEKPESTNPLSAIWPRDPLGDRRASFDAAIDLVRNSSAHSLDLDVMNVEGDLQAITSWIRDSQALINELHRSKDRADVLLPPRLSVSTLVALRDNPAELALAVRRPMPRPQDEYSRRGTVFHLWVEKHFGQGTLFDDEDLDPIDPLETDQTLEGLKTAWLASEWGDRQPYAVEVPFESVLAGVLLRGRIDAVYKIGDRFEVVDWKTGSKKLGESAAIQLAMYRLAWAKLQKIDPSFVSAAFHYVPTGITDRRADLLDEAGLIALLEKH